MTSKIYAYISKPLYDLIINEKRRLINEQKKKFGSRRKRITMVIASQSLVKRLG